MKKIVAIILVLIVLFELCSPKILKVIEITRHGGRTPLLVKPDGYLQEQLGQLTVLGFNQHILLGKWNRRRYIENEDSEYKDFLPNKFDPDLIKIVSSRFQRTQFSAIGNISGMYPGVTFKIKTENPLPLTNYGKPPIEEISEHYLDKYVDAKEVVYINIMDKKRDVIFSTHKCLLNYFNSKKKTSKSLLKSSIDKKEILDLIQEYLVQKDSDESFSLNYLTIEEKTKIKENFGNDFESVFNGKKLEEMTIKDFSKITDYLNFFTFSYKSPQNVYDYKPIENILRKITLRYMRHFMDQDKYVKLITSQLTNTILQDLEETIKEVQLHSNLTNKFVLYSAHDRNIQNLILNLFDTKFLNEQFEKSMHDVDAYNFLMVPYASSFIFELHEIDEELYIRIIYNGMEIKDNLKKIGKTLEERIIYIQDRGFQYSKFESLLKLRIEKNISDLKC